MTAALFTSVFSYVALSQIAVSTLPEGITGWEDYIGRIGEYSGIKGLPTFYAAHVAAGNLGVHFLGTAALAGILTGLIGNMVDVSLDECHGFYYMGHKV